MTRTASIALAIGAAVACLVLVGFGVVGGKFVSEDWCSDRWPWWGPPQDPASTCSGHAWLAEHPEDYPGNLPR